MKKSMNRRTFHRVIVMRGRLSKWYNRQKPSTQGNPPRWRQLAKIQKKALQKASKELSL